MSKLNLLNYNFTSLIMLFISYMLIIDEVGLLSNLFFLLLLILSIFLKSLKFNYKKAISSILAVGTIYILFVLNDYTLSKEYFINLILGLIFLKFSEIENKNHHYFFNYTCVFLAISSLIYGQDLTSSLLSFSIVILSIINLYSLNQSKVLQINIKNLFRYMIFALSIIPIIAIVYFVFPRTELNIKLFETKKNQLGIPDKISLGSFQNISDSDENVFIYTNKDEGSNKKFYFRVKVFDRLNENKDWITTEYKVLLSRFKNDFKITKIDYDKEIEGSLIMFPHEKKWIPKLINFNYKNNVFTNIINDTISLENSLSKKKSFNLIQDKKKSFFKSNMIEYYTELPNNISLKLIRWAQKNYQESKNEKEYLNKILKKFSNNNFYYSLTPNTQGNNYENFFFKTKTGYCEYYAGTFAILARIVGIPSRIVTGYYGGSYNELGDFYTFKQQDAHSWVEIFLDGDWVQYDPTQFVPNENILDSNNLMFENSKPSTTTSLEITGKGFETIGLYFNYANYVWTNSFLQYDEKSRKNFIKNNLTNLENYKYLVLFGLSIIFIYYFFKFLIFIKTKSFLFSLFFKKIKSKNKRINNHMTHQEIFLMLDENDKLNLKDLFSYYEKIKFSKNYQISLKNYYGINLKILKYAYYK